MSIFRTTSTVKTRQLPIIAKLKKFSLFHCSRCWSNYIWFIYFL